MVDTTFRPIDLPDSAITSSAYLFRDQSQITALNGGGYVVVWREEDTSAGDSENIFAQFFDANGVAAGAAISVNTTTTDMQYDPNITTLSNGDVVISWTSQATSGSGAGLYFQRYNSAGVAQGVETFVAADTASGTALGDIIGLAGGGFAISWISLTTAAGNDTATVFMQKYTNAGTLDGAVISLYSISNPTSGSSIPSAYLDGIQITELSSGNFAANFSTLNSQQLGIYSSVGVEITAPFYPQQNTAGGSGSYSGEVVELGNGNIMAVYAYTFGVNGSSYTGYGEIWGRIFDASGTAVGSEFAIVTGPDNRRFQVNASEDGQGGVMISYVEEGDIFGDGNNIYVQHVSETGTVLGTPQWFDYHNGGGFVSGGDFSVLANGNLISTFNSWTLYGGVQTREISAGDDSGFTTGNDTVTLGSTGEHVIALGGDDTVTGGIGDDIIEGRTGLDTLNGGDGNDNLFGDAGVDTLNGGDGDDFIWGGTENDIISGGAGNDHIDGGDDDDTINGNDNDDILIGGFGGDTINGGEGHDFIYGYAPLGREYPDDQNVDAGFHNILDGGNGNDTIYGGNGTDTISGGEGDDTLFGDVGYIGNGPGDDDTIYTGNGTNTANGGGGNDTIIGGSGIDTLYGSSGSDEIHGHGDNDRVNGGADDDDLFGEGGNDRLEGGTGEDHLYGGDGQDHMEGEEGADVLDGGDGRDTAFYLNSSAGVTVNLGNGSSGSGGEAEGDTYISIEDVYGSSHVDSITGTTGDNFLRGAGGDDVIAGGNGDDILRGDHGNDTIYTGEGTDTAYGGYGNDTIIGASTVDTIYGDQDNDVIYGRGGNDILDGGDGNDSLVGEGGDDTLDGGLGNDTLNGGIGEDIINGGDGDDTIYAGYDNDTIDGGAGADFIIAETGDDTINGGSGNDTIYTGNGLDTAYGGDNDDTILGGADIDYLYGDDGNDTLYSYGGADWLYGGMGNDSLVGGDGLDRLYGEDGSDTLVGGNGDDYMLGGAGTDLLYGGAGRDTMFGDGGDDTLFAGSGVGVDLLGGDGDDRLYGDTTSGQLGFFGGAGDDELYGSNSGVNNFHFFNSDGVQTDRVSFFKVGDTIGLHGYGFTSIADSHSSFTQNGANVFFSAGSTTSIFYNANLADVQAAVGSASAENPSPVKAIVSEDVDSQAQDAIAEFLDALDTALAPHTYVNAYGVLEIYDDNNHFDDYGYGLTHIA